MANNNDERARMLKRDLFDKYPHLEAISRNRVYWAIMGYWHVGNAAGNNALRAFGQSCISASDAIERSSTDRGTRRTDG